MSEQIKQMNLWQKLAAISKEAGHVEKTGFNSGMKFNFIEHSELMGLFRPVLEKYGVTVTVEALSATFSEAMTAGGKPTRHVSLAMAYTVTNADNPDQHFSGNWWSESQGNDDKNINKALTAGEKNIFMKLFHVSDADPDADEVSPPPIAIKTQNRTNVPIARQPAQEAASAPKPAPTASGTPASPESLYTLYEAKLMMAMSQADINRIGMDIRRDVTDEGVLSRLRKVKDSRLIELSLATNQGQVILEVAK